MQVILKEPIKKLGKIGDIVEVKDGFGRNFLLPYGKAVRASNENKKLFEAQKQELEKRHNEQKAAAEKMVKAIAGKECVVIKQTSDDGRLFGSVSAKEIAAIVGSDIKHNDIHIAAPIKNVGIYEVVVSPYAAVEATIIVNVSRSESEAALAYKEFKSGGKKDKAEDSKKPTVKFEEKAEEATEIDSNQAE